MATALVRLRPRAEHGEEELRLLSLALSEHAKRQLHQYRSWRQPGILSRLFHDKSSFERPLVAHPAPVIDGLPFERGQRLKRPALGVSHVTTCKYRPWRK